jgi:paraquat-inducible protein A
MMKKACPDCDLLVTMTPLKHNERALCPRCDAVLARGGRSMDAIFALILSGLLLWVSSLVLPILTLDVNGVQQPLSLWQTAFAMLDQEAWLLAILVAMTSFVAPFFHLAMLLWLFLPLRFERKPPFVGWAFRLLYANQGWMMLEVFFLSLLVTAVKLADSAQLLPGWSLLAFVALMLVMSAIQLLFDPDVYWRAVEECR